MNQSITSILSRFEARLRAIERQVQQAAAGGGPRRSSRRPPAPAQGQGAINQDLHDDINTLLAEFLELRDKVLQRTPSAEAGRSSGAAAATIRQVPAALEPQSTQTTKTAASVDHAGEDARHTDPPEKFFLSLAQMEQGAIHHLAQFAEDPAFGAMVKMETPPFDWDTLKEQIPAKPDHDLCFVKWECDGVDGASRLFVSESTAGKWQLPDLSSPSEKPSDTEALAFLENMAHDPPKARIAYYVGRPFASDFNQLAQAGDQLGKLDALDGINKPYWHLGKAGSGTAFHCEDAHFRSSNFVVGPGWKLWLMIRYSDTAKFEAFVRRRWGGGSCGQWLRHLSLFIAPKVLDEEGVGYDIIVAGQGDLVVTRPRQYHCVVNYSDCLALAINHLFPGEPTFPTEVAVCNNCGLFPIEHPSFIRVAPPSEVPGISCNDSGGSDDDNGGGGGEPTVARRKRRPPAGSRLADRAPKRSRSDAGPANLKETRASARALLELEEMAKSIRKLDSLCNIPTFTNEPLPTPQLLLCASAIRSREAVSQLVDLIRSDRDLGARDRRPQNSPDQVVRCLRAIKQTGNDLRLGKLYMRLYKVELFDLVQALTKGEYRAPSFFTSIAQKDAGCPPSTYHMYKKEGGDWRNTCGPYEGILSLIPLEKQFGLSPKAYLDFSQGDMAVFHSLLAGEYIAKITTASLMFQRSLQHGSRPVEFVWESTGICLQTCEERELLEKLQPVPFTDVNIWNSSRFTEAPTPDFWPQDWDWPADPTAVRPTEIQCDFCTAEECACSNIAEGLPPQVKAYSQGRGLRAIAQDAGGVAYSKDDFLGVVSGEIHPLGTYTDSHWTFDLHRPDVQDSPAACQIRLEEVASWFRLLIASEKPTARLVTKRRGGRWVMAVEAEQDIRDCDQISVLSVPWSRSDLAREKDASPCT